MWTCPACEYVNDELAEACRRCDMPRPAATDITAAIPPGRAEFLPLAENPDDTRIEPAPQTVEERLLAELGRRAPGGDAAEPVLPKEAPPSIVLPQDAPRRSGSEALALIVILVAVVGLAGVIFAAWRGGHLDGLLGRDTKQPAPLVVNIADRSAVLDAPDDDPLLALNDDLRALRPYRRYADVLRETDAELAATRIEAVGPGALSEASRRRLYELEPLGRRLLTQYEDFEARAARDTSEVLAPYQDLLRGEFIKRMDALLGVLGQAYALQDGLNHAVFLLSDALPDAVAAAGRADAEPLRERWLAAVHSRDQRLMDAGLAEEFRQLSARLGTLKDLHNDFNRLFSGMGEYRIRGGNLNAVAEELLGHYDDLAQHVEALALEHAEYVSTLPTDLRSARLRELIDEFLTLAQQDHFYAFSETYAIYERDRFLEHPAYERLRDRVEFVKEHWPSQLLRYEATYHAAEQRWIDRFAPHIRRSSES